MITPYTLKHRRDQVSFSLNQVIDQLASMQNSIRILSSDRKQVIIIGEQPTNPATNKPYPFGIKTYNIKGDRLEEA